MAASHDRLWGSRMGIKPAGGSGMAGGETGINQEAEEGKRELPSTKPLGLVWFTYIKAKEIGKEVQQAFYDQFYLHFPSSSPHSALPTPHPL